MNTYRTLTREARAVCAILAIGILALLWAIQVDASIGDDYGALILAGALATISALGAFIVTSELRDDNAKQLRARMSRLHTQQVNTLSDAIVKLETHNDNYARKFAALVIDNTATELLNKQLSTIARDVNKGRITANAEYRQLRAQLETVTRGAYLMAWALCEDNDLRDSCLSTLHGINKLEVSDSAKYLKFAETELQFYSEIDQDGRDVAPLVTDYTHSASTALVLGTLDKAYSLANGETVYPLA